MKIDNLIAINEYKRNNEKSTRKKVVVEKGGNIIFNDVVTVITGDDSNFNRIDILWDDVISEDEYHNLGLYGYYSPDYCMMSYCAAANLFKIKTTEGITISIMK